MLARQIAADGDTEEKFWKLLAFMGRYGHQDMLAWRDVPISDLRRAARALGRILEEESEANRRASSSIHD